MDLPFHTFLSFWNFTLKVFYISTSLYIVFLMTRVYARTREREKAWKIGLWSLLGSIVSAPVVAAIFMGKKPFSAKYWFEVCDKLELRLSLSVLTSVLDSLYVYAHPRVALHPSSVASPPPDIGPYRYR